MGYTTSVTGSTRGEHGQPGGQRAKRVERPRQEEQRHYQHPSQRHERLHLRYPGRHHYAERGKREGKQQELADYGEDENGIVRNMREPGQSQNDDSLKGGNSSAAEAFPDNDR